LLLSRGRDWLLSRDGGWLLSRGRDWLLSWAAVAGPTSRGGVWFCRCGGFFRVAAAVRFRYAAVLVHGRFAAATAPQLSCGVVGVAIGLGGR
ncbi:hypothetical protein ACIBCD_01570, partial [Nocardia brasiliensis]|uniref:hypothetical protein n=1 Tax=Nocardia brasiliensis TaxID=37326 RepID=UPI0037A29682